MPDDPALPTPANPSPATPPVATAAARHRRLMDLFDQACDLPAEEQDALVARLRTDQDQALADQLAGMLVSDRGPGLELAAAPLPVHSVHPDASDPDRDPAAASNDPAELLGLMSTTNPDDLPDHPTTDVIDRRRLGELAHYARRIDVRRYELLGLLGEGGMGVVLRARQRQPNRLVAIKLLRPNSGSDKLKKRFAAEGQVLARLSHKGIAKIYEAVVDTPEPYIVMELVDGRPLNEVAPDLTLPVRIALLADIADAVDHAHKNGIVHRDLKPANILVEPDNNPKVLDFGIARVVSGDTPVTTLTNVGELLGTPAFMSPEQIAGGNIGPHTDVYALGVVAYEVLTGRMPYDLDGLDVFSAFAQIREAKPIPLGKVDRHLKGDLEVIVGKALEKEPNLRYATAAAMADDLRRVLAFEPIRARPPSALYQLARFARRNRALSVAVLALFLTLVTGVIVATRFYVAAEDARHALTGRVDDLLLTQSRSLLNTDPTSAATTLAELSDSAPWPTAFTLAWAAKGRGISTVHPGRGAPLEWANIASDWAVLGSDDGTLRLIDLKDHTTGRLIDTVGHDGQINRAVFLPRDPELIPGALLASAGQDSKIKIWSEDGSLLHDIPGHVGEVEAIDVNPCGLITAGGDGTLRRLDPATLTLTTLATSPSALKDLVCAPDTKRIAAATDGSGVLVYDLQTRTPRVLSDGAFDHIAFAPDGHLAAGGPDGRIVVWSPTLETLYQLTPPPDQRFDVKGLVFVTATNPTHHDLVVVDRGGIMRRWELPSLQTRILAREGGIYRALTHSPDHHFLATASDDRTVGLWDLASESRLALLGHQAPVTHVAFGPDSRTLISSSEDGTARIWQLPDPPHRWPVNRPVSLAAFHAPPLTSRLAVGTLDGKVLGVTPGLAHLQPLTPHTDVLYQLAFSHDGELLASTSRDLAVTVHTLSSAKPHNLATFLTSHRPVRPAFSHNGRLLAVGLATSAVAAFDLQARAPLTLGSLPSDAGRAEYVTWQANRLVVGTASGKLFAYSFETSSPPASPPPATLIDSLPSAVHGLVAHGPWLAVSTLGGEVRRYHSDGSPTVVLNHDGAAHVALTANGDLATGGHDGKLHARFDNGQHTLLAHSGAVTTLATDGTWVASGGVDRTVTLWRPFDETIFKIKIFDAPLRAVALVGADLFTLADEDDLQRWPLPLPSTRASVDHLLGPVTP